MPASSPFPIQVEDLTPEFLAAALRRDVVDFDATRVGADRGMLGEIFILDITEAAGTTMRLAAKFAARREGSLESARRGRNYERELRCYEQLLAETPTRTPTCHGTWYDPNTAHFLLLQEAIESSADADQIAGITVDQAKRVLDQVAPLHAHWWRDEGLQALDWLPRLDADLRIANLTALARAGWPRLQAMLGDQALDVPADFGAELPGQIEASLRSIASLPHTLLHCDLRADNLLFEGVEGTAALIDWQGCGIGPAAFDLAYFLVQSLTIDDRRAHEGELLDYWQMLVGHPETVTDNPTSGYAESIWYGMAVACALPVISDPEEPRVRELAHCIASRTLTALIDHEQLQERT